MLASVGEQEKLFYRIFPQQVDAGARKSTTLDWMLSRTADGTKQTAPRELIHLLSAARDEQLKLLEMGAPEPTGEMIFSPAALKGALPIVSAARYNQTLCPEHPTLKSWMAKLEGEKTQQTPGTLAKIWQVSEPKTLATAEKLSEIGFFERRGTKEQPIFWVPSCIAMRCTLFKARRNSVSGVQVSDPLILHTAKINSSSTVQPQPLVDERQAMRAIVFRSFLQRAFPDSPLLVHVQTVDCKKFLTLVRRSLEFGSLS